MKVCIEKSDDGQFSVYQEHGGAMPGESPAPAPEGPQNKQPARDLQEALIIAGKMLSQESEQGMGSSPFDEGLRMVLPQRPGMGGL